MTTRGLLLLIITVAACGGANSTATEPADVEAPDRCAADPAVAATRMPRPAAFAMRLSTLQSKGQSSTGSDSCSARSPSPTARTS